MRTKSIQEPPMISNKHPTQARTKKQRTKTCDLQRPTWNRPVVPKSRPQPRFDMYLREIVDDMHICKKQSCPNLPKVKRRSSRKLACFRGGKRRWGGSWSWDDAESFEISSKAEREKRALPRMYHWLVFSKIKRTKSCHILKWQCLFE